MVVRILSFALGIIAGVAVLVPVVAFALGPVRPSAASGRQQTGPGAVPTTTVSATKRPGPISVPPPTGTSSAARTRTPRATRTPLPRSTPTATVTAAPTRTATPTVTPSPSSAGLNVKQLGAKGDGVTDDTAAIQKALNTAAASGGTVYIPAGTYRYSKNLVIQGGSNVVVQGDGDASILRAADPGHSAVAVYGSSHVVLKSFRVESPSATSRSSADVAAGVLVAYSSFVEVNGVTAVGPAESGMMVTDGAAGPSHDVVIHHSTVRNSLADGFHVTGGAYNVTLDSNSAYGTGDDSFASIGYQSSGGANRNITVTNNYSEYSAAGGVGIEGSAQVTVSGNRILASVFSGIRVQSNASYRTVACSDVIVSGNTLTGVKTGTAGVGAIMVAANFQDISNVTIANNTVTGTLAERAIRAFGTNGYAVRGVTIDGNTVDNARSAVVMGIEVASVNSVVTNNHVTDASYYGVDIAPGASGSLTVSRNLFERAQVDAIHFEGGVNPTPLDVSSNTIR